jgi:hypothetical protein
MASPPPEPCRDQETISSFKRTFNSAVLTLVARNGNGRVGKYGVATLGAILAWHFRSDISAFLI